MREVPLTKGYTALVDEADYERVVAAGPWHAHVKAHVVYAISSKQIRLHRFLLAVTDPKVQVDHKNHNGLDNRRGNLRLATQSQNSMNARKRRGTSSPHKGVEWSKQHQKWRARIQVNGKRTVIGYFNTEPEAAVAYYDAAQEVFKGFYNSKNIPKKD